MKPQIRLSAALAAVLFIFLSSRSVAEFRAGASAVVITPPAGTPIAGYYALRTADGVLDDLYAKALVVEQEGERAAFVTLDLITVTRPVVQEARRLIAEQSGIAPERVMISATHSHTGPVITRGTLIDGLTGGDTLPVQDFTSDLPAHIARSVAEAISRLQGAKASVVAGTAERLGFNRRYWMNDGTVAWNPAKLSPKILAPAGPTDPEFRVLHMESVEAKATPLATYVNFAMHPDVVGGTRISADYPGVVARLLAQARGKEMITLFANGCCGNINHQNVWWADPQRGPQECERIGTVLAGAVLGSWPSLTPVQTKAPQTRSRILQLPVHQFSPAELDEAREGVRRIRDPKLSTTAKAKALCVLDTLAREGKPYEVEVQVIALSEDVAFVSMPGEIFVELGLAIKRASPFEHTFIAELANGSVGYVPNRAAYSEGGYEVASARCAEGTGELLADTAIELLNALKPTPAPAR